MKKEKLELLLNKVVSFTKTKKVKGFVFEQPTIDFKGFLYKEENSYYIKVVEVNLGSMNFNERYYLEDGDDEFIVVAESPKLMRVSKNSWHYRLMKFVLKSNAPTPKDMQNGCPYFWLVMFSILVLPFILLWNVFWFVITLVPKIMLFFLEKMVNSWLDNIDDETAYDLYNGGYNAKMPKTAQLFFKHSDDEFFEYFLSKKDDNYNKRDGKYTKKIKDMADRWKIWSDELERNRSENRRKTRFKRIERENKQQKSSDNWERRMKPIVNSLNKISTSIRKTFTIERGRVNMIIKRTKQFMGALITLFILAVTFIIINYASLALMVTIDWCIENWKYFMMVGIGGVAVGIGYLLYVVVGSWVQNIVNEYKRGRKIWYVEPLIYTIYYPLKYVVMGIAFSILHIIWKPFIFIFYTVLFKHFLKPIGIGVATLTVSLVKGIIGSSGIFGEYFGASYSDYCPGIEWTDFDEEDEINEI